MENELNYIQKFHTSDNIIVQAISDSPTPPTTYIKSLTEPENKEFLSLATYPIGDEYCHYINLKGIEDDVWQIVLGGHKSVPFEVCDDDSILYSTKRIRYTNTDNDTPFDNVFVMNGEQVYFDFRLECGFKSNGLQPKLDDESFRDQMQRIHHLYSSPYLVETLTFGSAFGIPAFYCSYLNNVFCLDNIAVGEKSVQRSESSVPELNQLIDGSQRYVMTMNVEVVDDHNLEDKTDEILKAITNESGDYVITENGNVMYTEVD